jgi:hypothetical protein
MKKRIIFFVTTLFFGFLIACVKDSSEDNASDNTVPEVTTSAISEITSTSAKSGGAITKDGGSSVSQRGVCFGTAINPSLTDSYTADGSGTGNYVSTISGLLPNKDYFARAYATNNNGTGYGSSIQFKTSQALLEGTYTQQDKSWIYIKILDSGNNIQYYMISDEPNSYCTYENRGKLTSNPTTGFVVEGDWYKFNSSSAWCNGSVWVVQQKDNNTVIIRYHEYNTYDSAYDLGTNITFKK